MALVNNRFNKDPNATLDYEVDWAKWLGTDTITASTWAAGAGITVSSSTNTTTTATVWLSGGTVDTDYTIVNHITTTAGRIDDRTFAIRVQQK